MRERARGGRRYPRGSPPFSLLSAATRVSSLRSPSPRRFLNMSSQQQQAAAAPPQPVGNAFVFLYYHILHHSPELVHRFYQDASKLGRPDAGGALSTITTMQAINEKIVALEYSEYKSEIKTVDAQESYNSGVLVLVTGYVTGKDNVKRNFTQSFFLAPQDKGYFVLNDIFRYVDEGDQQQQQPENQGSANGPEVPLSHEDEFLQPHEEQVPEQTASPPEGEEANGEEVVDNPSESDEGSVVDEEAPTSEVVDEVQNNSQAVVDSSPALVLEEAPNKSYASIVKVMKENAAPSSFPAAPPARPSPANPPRQTTTVAASFPAPEVPAAGSHGAESDVQEAEADGYSIYIKNLPLNATVAQLEEEFKRFGPIKFGGIQVRSNKQQGFCFGFVEFEVASAVQSAIEASPITIGGRQAYIEEKRPSGSRGDPDAPTAFSVQEFTMLLNSGLNVDLPDYSANPAVDGEAVAQYSQALFAEIYREQVPSMEEQRHGAEASPSSSFSGRNHMAADNSHALDSLEPLEGIDRGSLPSPSEGDALAVGVQSEVALGHGSEEVGALGRTPVLGTLTEGNPDDSPCASGDTISLADEETTSPSGDTTGIELDSLNKGGRALSPEALGEGNPRRGFEVPQPLMIPLP